MTRPLAWEIVAFALALSVAGLVLLAIVLSGSPLYEQLAREGGFDRGAFSVPTEPGRAAPPHDIASLVALHRSTRAYVMGDASGLDVRVIALLTSEEEGHLDDVRRVMAGARAAMLVATGVLVLLVARAWRGHGLGFLARDGALGAAGAVTVLAALAGLAFDAAFLAFHQLFFPQGNFLFDPGTSNLLSLYPEAYWYGISLRIGGAFLLASLAIAAIGQFVARGAVWRR